MASFIKRGRTWRAMIARQGIRDSKTFDTKAQADAWATKREAEIMAGVRGEIIPHTVAEALRRYAADVSPTKRGCRWELVRLKKLERELGFANRLLPSVAPSDLAAWRDRSLIRLATASVRREMVLLRSVFERARKEWGWLAANPIQGVAFPAHGQPRDRRTTDDEIDRILLALNYERETIATTTSQRVAVAYLWALETAMRAGEVVGLRPGDVHPDAQFAALQRTKNGSGRKVPLSRAAVALLECLPASDPVFDLTAASLDALFRKATKRAQIVDITFHDSRHEAITRLARKLDVMDLARMTGHRDIRQLMHYYNATATEIAARL